MSVSGCRKKGRLRRTKQKRSLEVAHRASRLWNEHTGNRTESVEEASGRRTGQTSPRPWRAPELAGRCAGRRTSWLSPRTTPRSVCATPSGDRGCQRAGWHSGQLQGQERRRQLMAAPPHERCLGMDFLPEQESHQVISRAQWGRSWARSRTLTCSCQQHHGSWNSAFSDWLSDPDCLIWS